MDGPSSVAQTLQRFPHTELDWSLRELSLYCSFHDECSNFTELAAWVCSQNSRRNAALACWDLRSEEHELALCVLRLGFKTALLVMSPEVAKQHCRISGFTLLSELSRWAKDVASKEQLNSS